MPTRKPSSPRKPVKQPVVGWREWVGFPDMGIDGIKAKVDTGARTSALHAFGVEEFEKGGQMFVRFVVHPVQGDSSISVPVELPLLTRRRVRDSSGKVQLRPVVRTTISLLGTRWPIELTLTRRDLMGFRMLLGRQAIRRKFIVDPAGSFYGGRRESKEKRTRRTEKKKK